MLTVRTSNYVDKFLDEWTSKAKPHLSGFEVGCVRIWKVDNRVWFIHVVPTLQNFYNSIIYGCRNIILEWWTLVKSLYVLKLLVWSMSLFNPGKWCVFWSPKMMKRESKPHPPYATDCLSLAVYIFNRGGLLYVTNQLENVIIIWVNVDSLMVKLSYLLNLGLGEHLFKIHLGTVDVQKCRTLNIFS